MIRSNTYRKLRPTYYKLYLFFITANQFLMGFPDGSLGFRIVVLEKILKNPLDNIVVVLPYTDMNN